MIVDDGKTRVCPEGHLVIIMQWNAYQQEKLIEGKLVREGSLVYYRCIGCGRIYHIDELKLPSEVI